MQEETKAFHMPTCSPSIHSSLLLTHSPPSRPIIQIPLRILPLHRPHNPPHRRSLARFLPRPNPQHHRQLHQLGSLLHVVPQHQRHPLSLARLPATLFRRLLRRLRRLWRPHRRIHKSNLGDQNTHAFDITQNTRRLHLHQRRHKTDLARRRHQRFLSRFTTESVWCVARRDPVHGV